MDIHPHLNVYILLVLIEDHQYYILDLLVNAYHHFLALLYLIHFRRYMPHNIHRIYALDLIDNYKIYMDEK